MAALVVAMGRLGRVSAMGRAAGVGGGALRSIARQARRSAESSGHYLVVVEVEGVESLADISANFTAARAVWVEPFHCKAGGSRREKVLIFKVISGLSFWGRSASYVLEMFLKLCLRNDLLGSQNVIFFRCAV